jgi:hypothetical protein
MLKQLITLSEGNNLYKLPGFFSTNKSKEMPKEGHSGYVTLYVFIFPICLW